MSHSSRMLLGAAAMALCTLAACSQPARPPEAQTPAPQAQATPAPPVVPVTLEIVDAAGVAMIGDPAGGRRVFLQCQSCHSVVAGDNRVGPSLHNIIGRAAGSVEGFTYTEANRTSGITWTQQQLFDYLESPRTKVPGTNMVFAGLRDPQQRADLIAYLSTNAMD